MSDPRTSAPERVLLAYSGGLDTSFLVAWLVRERGAEVTTLSVDCGGWDAGERSELEARALALGATAGHLRGPVGGGMHQHDEAHVAHAQLPFDIRPRISSWRQLMYRSDHLHHSAVCCCIPV